MAVLFTFVETGCMILSLQHGESFMDQPLRPGYAKFTPHASTVEER